MLRDGLLDGLRGADDAGLLGAAVLVSGVWDARRMALRVYVDCLGCGMRIETVANGSEAQRGVRVLAAEALLARRCDCPDDGREAP